MKESPQPPSFWVRALAVGAVIVTLFHPSKAPANVQEQRERLPPPATCEDPVEGVWLAHVFNADVWYIFTLRVRRAASGSPQLIGTIESRAWNGSSTESEPPSCRTNLSDWLVEMSAVGTFENGVVTFGGTEWHVKEIYCGYESVQSNSYFLDHFQGRIDSALQEFQSVNNDGETFNNDPAVFRRIECLEPNAAPHVQIAPPPFYPTRRGGCGCND